MKGNPLYDLSSAVISASLIYEEKAVFESTLAAIPQKCASFPACSSTAQRPSSTAVVLQTALREVVSSINSATQTASFVDDVLDNLFGASADINGNICADRYQQRHFSLDQPFVPATLQYAAFVFVAPKNEPVGIEVTYYVPGLQAPLDISVTQRYRFCNGEVSMVVESM